MKTKNKGKVHPSLFSSSNGDDHLSVFKLLPSMILVLVSVLSAEDQEVLAYLITRSLNTTITTAVSSGRKSTFDSKKSSKKKRNHKPPIFDCDCFDCYTYYWFRWDSSPNRELIHQIIEAFEDHLTSGENSASQKSKRNHGREKKREKLGRPEVHMGQITDPLEAMMSSGEVPPEKSPEILSSECGAEIAGDRTEKPMKIVAAVHKGLARKVLPDVLGLFNSRLWNLWNPNT